VTAVERRNWEEIENAEQDIDRHQLIHSWTRHQEQTRLDKAIRVPKRSPSGGETTTK
jgi:hypothetical protein